jgi:hypothetical protein
MYKYEDLREQLFTDKGQRVLLKARDAVLRLMNTRKVMQMGEALEAVGYVTADSWLKLACVDRLVELGELREIPQDNPAGQHRLFVRGDSFPSL